MQLSFAVCMLPAITNNIANLYYLFTIHFFFPFLFLAGLFPWYQPTEQWFYLLSNGGLDHPAKMTGRLVKGTDPQAADFNSSHS